MTFSANMGFEFIDPNAEQHATQANEVFVDIDAAFSQIDIAMSDANYTLSTSTTPQEWKYGMLKLTGTLTGGRDVIVPTNKKLYVVSNGTGFAVTLKTSAGTGIAVAAGASAFLRCDGTNVIAAMTAGAGVGDVVGPASATDGHFSQFDGATGKLLKGGIALDIDGTLTANSDTRVASQKAVKTYVDSAITGGATDVMLFKGVIDCSANPNYPAADAGNLYKISVAGKIGGASGIDVEAGDTVYCLTDSTAAGTQAAVGANWNIAQANITASGDTLVSEGALINSATSKTTPVDADYLGLMDSAASNILKKLSWANLKATLKTYFDTLYGYLGIPQNSQSAAYTTVLADAGKHILHPSADTTARTITIDSNANVAYPVGTAITFVNQNAAGVMTIAITTDTMRLAGAGTTGSRTLAANGIATALKLATTEWIISGSGLT